MTVYRELVVKPLTRSPKWRKVRKQHLKDHPRCACCGRTTKLEVHHKKSFSEYPGLELEPANLITLCGGSTKCHFVFGHFGYWKINNDNVMIDVRKYFHKYLKARSNMKNGKIIDSSFSIEIIVEKELNSPEPSIFNINGNRAFLEDFGVFEDSIFIKHETTDETLNRYNISNLEYLVITDKLEQSLSS